MDTLDRYDDGIFALQYDLSEGERSRHGDIEFYRDALTGTKGTVLELGCGTGRITIPLARAGVAVTGLDNARAVVDIARKKAVAAGVAVDFVVADAVEARLGRRFAAAFMGYNTITLIENDRVEALAANVARHLEPGGRFLFDVTRAAHMPFDGDGTWRVPWSEPIAMAEAGVVLRRRMEMRLRPEASRIECWYFWEITHPDGRLEERTTAMPFSTWEPEQYVEIFTRAGLGSPRVDECGSGPEERRRAHAFVELTLAS